MDRPPLRVLHLITDLGKGGAERFLLDLCTAWMGRSDVEFRIGTLYPIDEYPEYTRELPIECLHYSSFSLRGPNDYSSFRRLMESFQPHVVHTHRFLAEFLSSQYLSGDVAYVCHGHDNMVQFARLRLNILRNRRALLNWVEKRYLVLRKYRKARTAFVANSRHTLGYFKEVLPGYMREDVHLLEYGFDYERFRARTPGKAPSRNRPLRLINIGSFQDKKNQIFLVDVARRLRESGVSFEMHLLGDGVNRSRVQEAVDQYGLGVHMTLHGNVERVEEWLWRSDLYVHVARYEPFGLVLLEAMAAGLPCVVLDGKGNRDLIREGRNGFLLSEEDAGSFAARVRQVAASPADYRRMSAYARKFALDYDIGEASQRFLEFYHRLRAGWGGGGG